MYTKIPSAGLQSRIKRLFDEAIVERQSALSNQTYADQTLYENLGLADWKPPLPLTYHAKASAVRDAGRLDSEVRLVSFAIIFCAANPQTNCNSRVVGKKDRRCCTIEAQNLCSTRHLLEPSITLRSEI